VSGLYALGAASQPYFQVTHGLLLYLITPLVVVSSFLLYLSPGGILVLALGKVRTVPEWTILAFGSSLLLSIFLGTAAKLLLRSPLTSSILLFMWLGAAMLSMALLAFRSRRGGLGWPVTGWPDVRRGLWMIGAAGACVAALLPKIFWENFNVDGIEAFEFGRSLSNHVLPYWEIQNGVFGFYHNFVLFAYPNHWFITLLGPFEAAARLPFILYLVVLFAALTLLIELGTSKALSWKEELALWLGLVLYTVVQTYNTNYEPFFADLAEMAATDTLFVLLFTSACYLLWTGRLLWFCAAALMTCLASPGGLLLFGALAIATFLAKPQGWRTHLKAVCGVILVWALVGVAYEIFYNQLYLGGVNNQFSAKNMLRRLYPPTVGEFVRFNALLFPSGLLPALSLFAIRRKDSFGWMIGVVTVVYFVTLYLQAWTALHQFTPIMILPLMVFWRVYLGASTLMRKVLVPAVSVSTVVALMLSLPTHFKINHSIRQFGQATEYKIGDYEQSYQRAVSGGRSLYALLPEDYRLKYPEQPWGADHLSWIYYATRPKPPGTSINYTIQSTDDPPPPTSTLVVAKDGVSVYVRDFETWRRDREPPFPRVAVSPIYEPILRRTYQFFRAYVESTERKAQAGGV